MRAIGHDCLEQAERVDAIDVRVRQEGLNKQACVQVFICRLTRREGKCGISGRHRSREQADVKQAGNKEIPGTCVLQQSNARQQPIGYFSTKRVRRSTSRVENVVASAFHDVESFGIGFEIVLAEVEGYLLGNARDREGTLRHGRRNLGPAERIVCAAGERRRDLQAVGPGKMIDPDGAIRKSSVVVRRSRYCTFGRGEDVADIAITVTENVNRVEWRMRRGAGGDRQECQ